MNQLFRFASVSAVVLLATSPAWAEADPLPPPCTQPEARAFDFWLGEWEVRRTTDGQLQGLDRIERILDGCVLEQHWAQQNADFQPPGSPNFLLGRSYTVYAPPPRFEGKPSGFVPLLPAWHQIWVDNGGGLLHLAGDWKDGRMQLESVTPLRQKWRFVWEPKQDGSIHNWGHFSRDGGVTWTKYFDITYRRAGSAREDGPPISEDGAGTSG